MISKSTNYEIMIMKLIDFCACSLWRYAKSILCPRGYIKGGYYFFKRLSSAGIIRVRVLFERGSYLRKYGMYVTIRSFTPSYSLRTYQVHLQVLQGKKVFLATCVWEYIPYSRSNQSYFICLASSGECSKSKVVHSFPKIIYVKNIIILRN